MDVPAELALNVSRGGFQRAKSLQWALWLCVLTGPATAAADEPCPGVPERRVSVTLQPLPWAFGVYSGAAEVAVASRWSLVLGANVVAVTFFSSQNDNTSQTTLTGGGLQPGVHWYLWGRAPLGLWLGLQGELSYLSLESTTSQPVNNGVARFTTRDTGWLYGGHGMIGYTHAFWNGLTVTGGLGVGGNGSSLSRSSTTGVRSQPLALAASFGRVSLGIGWSW